MPKHNCHRNHSSRCPLIIKWKHSFNNGRIKRIFVLSLWQYLSATEQYCENSSIALFRYQFKAADYDTKRFWNRHNSSYFNQGICYVKLKCVILLIFEGGSAASCSWTSLLRYLFWKRRKRGKRKIWRPIPSCSSYDEVAKIHFKCILASSQNYSVQIPKTTWQMKTTQNILSLQSQIKP